MMLHWRDISRNNINTIYEKKRNINDGLRVGLRDESWMKNYSHMNLLNKIQFNYTEDYNDYFQINRN